jgi:flagellar M-ring protein FliF
MTNPDFVIRHPSFSRGSRMNFLNNAIAQLSDLFRSMTPGARVTAGLLLAVVVVSVGFLFRQATSGPDAFLFGGAAYSDGELTRMEAAIAQAKLTGHAREGNRLRVPAGQQAAYIAAIADGGALPPNINTILEDAINKSSRLESREMTRERVKVARQRLLSEIVRAMNWVEDAVVIYDEEEPKGLNPQKQVTASVGVRPKLGESLDPQRAENLKTLIARSILGLTPEMVAVTNLDGGEHSTGGALDPAVFDNPYYRARIAWERAKEQSILAILSDIPGVQVKVNAELDDTLSETITSSVPDKTSSTAVRTTETRETSTQTAVDPNGRPGPVTNSATGPSQINVAEAPARQNQNQTTGSTETTENVVGQESRIVTRQGFTPKDGFAAVAIPTKYFQDVWKSRNPDATTPPTPEDLKIIKDEVITTVGNMVETLLVTSADRARDTFNRVTVVAMDTLPVPAIEPPSMASKALSWTGRYWNTLAMLGVAVFGLMVLKSVVKGAPPAALPPAVAAAILSPSTDDASHRAEPDGEATPDERPRLRLKKGTTVKDDLVDIVREDPDAAAEILRSWISKAG